MPVFMRIGDGEEFKVGDIEPEISDLDDNGAAYVSLPASAIPELLRRAADLMGEADGS
jgi:hypothetical protein